MAETRVGRAVLTIEIDGKQYEAALGELDRRSDKTAEHVRGIGQALNLAVFREFGEKAVAAVGAVVNTIVELGQRGATVGDVAATFDTLTASVGDTSQAMLGELRAGTVGAIEDFELMRLANSALGAGLIRNSQDMGTLAAGARQLAKATGGDTVQAFDSLTSAIASGRTATLKQLGLFVDSKAAVEQYARAHNKAAADLNDFERAQALSAATLDALHQRLQLIPPDGADFGEMLDFLKVQLSNFRDQLAVVINDSPVLQAGLKAAGQAVSEAFGANQAAAVDAVKTNVEELAIGAVRGAQVMVEGARFVSNAWDGLKVIFNATALVLTQAVYNIAQSLGVALQKAAEVSGIGEKFAGPAATVKAFAEDVRLLGVSFERQAEDAITSAGQTNAAFDVAQQVLGRTIAGMLAAQGQAAATSASIGNSLAGATTGASQRTDEAVQAIADSYRKLSEDVALATMEGTARRLAELDFAKQAELQRISELKQATQQEKDEQIRLATEKYQILTQLALLDTDQTRQRTQQLQQEVAQDYLTGTALVVAQLQAREQAELASIATLQVTNATAYAEQAALIQQHYANLTAAAQGHYQTVEQAAAAAGFKTREELEQEANKAAETYRRMLESGKFTEDELDRAREAAAKAEAERDGKVYKGKQELMDAQLAGASTILRSIFGKSKAAAIAAAIIDTYAAVAKALSAYPWPWNLVPAGAALAAGMQQVNQIRSQNPEGFKVGTPGLDFANFGRVSLSALHGQEAVIPRGKGHLLAAEIAAAMPGGGRDVDLGARIDRMVAAIEELPRQMRRAYRDGLLMAT